ncbi:PBS lyase HEAT domain protein repeat-containing protein [[Leptolyngbya] sp. PCC 7376]|uniref:HEAT repeat domain-containing protein n=1 Tax=[Leptolyngbya] sp. PCC 7376 TaxID=111781 RepID=UPI00029F2857|nr:HEAT repeat domain-containing protein [[Leptolyngbya] sp. PCC 7376]AFY40459.1 PBS lyase HEAT domain protein repeat-containing protein [[Leptolyngbya] sp. PCC 7376]
MGHVEAEPAIALGQPTTHQFLKLCAETDIAKISSAADWGLQLLIKGDFQERWRIAKVLSKVGTSVILPLLAIAEDTKQETELRWFAIRILGQHRNSEVLARLIILLENCSEEFLADEIMRALVKLEDKATDYLVPLLAQTETRLLAVKALCKVRYPNIVEPLLEVTDDPNPQIRELTIEALGGFRHSRIFDCLITALRDPVSTVRIEAIRALGFWANCVDKGAILKAVSPLLYDHNLDVCRQAGLTLSRLQTPEAVTAIAAVAKSEITPFVLKTELVQALGWIDHQTSIEVLAQLLETSSEPLTLEIVKIFGRLTSGDRQAQASDILLNFWQQQAQLPHRDLRQAIAYTLGQLKQASARPILEELNKDDDSAVQLHANAALNKLHSINP